MDIAKIISEEILTATEYERSNFGQRNGDEFPEIARAALSDRNVRALISTSSLFNMLTLSTRSGKELAEMMSDREGVAKNGDFNRWLLDMLWLGYRLGRRMQREEDKALEGIETERRAR
jgi:hypothetical protein